MGIFERSILGTSVALLAACGGRGSDIGSVRPEAVLPLDQLYVLESIGVPPDDTILTLDPSRNSVVLIRRGAPDNTIFAILRFPLGSLQALGGGLPGVSVSAVPGQVGLDLALSQARIVNDSATVTFAYPVHFLAPSGAEDRYGGPLGYERALAIGYDGNRARTYRLLRSSRPGSDLLMARVPGAGRYLVVAPR